MNSVTRDETYRDLVWVRFEGPDWDDYHALLSALKQFADAADDPFYLVFYPLIDMPAGSPISHMRRLVDFVNNEPTVLHMFAIVPKRMAIAKMFSQMASRIFPQTLNTYTILTDIEDVYPAYRQLIGYSDGS